MKLSRETSKASAAAMRNVNSRKWQDRIVYGFVLLTLSLPTSNLLTEAHGGRLVSPSAYENEEAPGASGAVWPNTARAMSIYGSPEFADFPEGGAFITELNLRPDRDTPAGETFEWDRYALIFSVTQVEPARILQTFASNVADDAEPVTVFDDRWSVVASEPDPDAIVRPFEYVAKLQTPFFYDPEKGNLLVDWIFEGNVSTSGRFDLDPENLERRWHATTWEGDSEAEVACCGAFGVPTEIVFQIPGDYNGDDELSAEDIDHLAMAIINDETSAMFDLNFDGTVDANDRIHWVHERKQTWLGDSNLDGEFNSADFVAVFQAGQFEDQAVNNSTWATGDWNGDREFNSGDFVEAFRDGGYNQGARNVLSVPEPSSPLLLVVGLIGLATTAHRKR